MRPASGRPREERLDALGGERVQLLGERPVRSSRSSPSGSGPREKTSAAAGPAACRRRVHRAAAGRRSPCPRPRRPHRPPRAARGRAPARLARHPALAGHRHAAVERDRGLVDHERPARRDPRAPHLVLRPCLGGVDLLHVDPAARSSSTPPAASGFGSRAPKTTRSTPAARIRVGARRRRALVRARLERDVEGRAARPLACGVERDALGMAAAGLRPSLADDLAVSHDDRADGRLRIRAVAPPARASSTARVEAHARLGRAGGTRAGGPRARRSRAQRRAASPRRRRSRGCWLR